VVSVGYWIHVYVELAYEEEREADASKLEVPRAVTMRSIAFSP
jgi:hypothetical protein